MSDRRLKKIKADCQVLATAIPKSMPILERRMAREDVPYLLAALATQRALGGELTKALEFYAAERHYEEETGAVGKLVRIPSTPDQAPGGFAFQADWGS